MREGEPPDWNGPTETEVHDYFMPWVTGTDYCYGAYRIVVSRGERGRAALETDAYIKSKQVHDYVEKNGEAKKTFDKMDHSLTKGFSVSDTEGSSDSGIPKFTRIPERDGGDPDNPGFHLYDSTYEDVRTIYRDDLIILTDFGEKVIKKLWAIRERDKVDKDGNKVKDEYGKYVKEQYLHLEIYHYYYETPYTVVGQYVDMNPTNGSTTINSGLKKAYFVAVDRNIVRKYVLNATDTQLLEKGILPSFDGDKPRGKILRTKEVERRSGGKEGDTYVHYAHLLSLSPDHKESIGWWTAFANAFMEELQRMREHPEVYRDKELSPQDLEWLNTVIADIEAQKKASGGMLPGTLEKVLVINKNGMPEEITPVDIESLRPYIFQKIDSGAMRVPTTLYKIDPDVTKSLVGFKDIVLMWETKAKSIADATWNAWTKLHPELLKEFYPTASDGKRIWRISDAAGALGFGFRLKLDESTLPVPEPEIDTRGFRGMQQRLRVQRPWYPPTLRDALPSKYVMTMEVLAKKGMTLDKLRNDIESHWMAWSLTTDWTKREKDYKVPVIWKESEWVSKDFAYTLDDFPTTSPGVWTNNAMPTHDWSLVYMTNTPEELGRWVFARAQSFLYETKRSKYMAFSEKYRPVSMMNRDGYWKIERDSRFDFEKIAEKTGAKDSGYAEGAVLGSKHWDEPYFPNQTENRNSDIWKLWFDTDRTFWHNLVPYFSAKLYFMHARVNAGIHYYDKKIAKGYYPQAQAKMLTHGLTGYLPMNPAGKNNRIDNDKIKFYAQQDSFYDRSPVANSVTGDSGAKVVEMWNQSHKPFASETAKGIDGRQDPKAFSGLGFSFPRNDPYYGIERPDLETEYHYRKADGTYAETDNAFDTGKYAITHVVKPNITYIPLSFWATAQWLINQETYFPFLKTEVLSLPPVELHELFWSYFPWRSDGADWYAYMSDLESAGYVIGYGKNMTKTSPPSWPYPVVSNDASLVEYYKDAFSDFVPYCVDCEYGDRQKPKLPGKPGGG